MTTSQLFPAFVVSEGSRALPCHFVGRLVGTSDNLRGPRASGAILLNESLATRQRFSVLLWRLAVYAQDGSTQTIEPTRRWSYCMLLEVGLSDRRSCRKHASKTRGEATLLLPPPTLIPRAQRIGARDRASTGVGLVGNKRPARSFVQTRPANNGMIPL